MVALPQVINVEEHAGQSGNTVLIPEGQYQAVAVESEMQDTSKGGKMIVTKFVITQGQYQNTELLIRLNVVNASQKAVEIANQEIANIGKALGLTHVGNMVDVHNKPLIIEVKNKKKDDWHDKDGNLVEGKETSEIKKYLPLPSGGLASAQAAPVAASHVHSAPVSAAPTQAAPVAPVAPVAAANPAHAPAPTNNPFGPQAGAAPVANTEDEIPF